MSAHRVLSQSSHLINILGKYFKAPFRSYFHDSPYFQRTITLFGAPPPTTSFTHITTVRTTRTRTPFIIVAFIQLTIKHKDPILQFIMSGGKPKSKYAIVKEGWGTRNNFQHSYGLGTSPEGYEEGTRILEEFQKMDSRAPEGGNQGSSGGGKSEGASGSGGAQGKGK